MPNFGTANQAARSIDAAERFQSEARHCRLQELARQRPIAGKACERSLRQRPAHLGRAQQKIERVAPILRHADAFAGVERHQVHGFCAYRSFHGGVARSNDGGHGYTRAEGRSATGFKPGRARAYPLRHQPLLAALEAACRCGACDGRGSRRRAARCRRTERRPWFPCSSGRASGSGLAALIAIVEIGEERDGALAGGRDIAQRRLRVGLDEIVMRRELLAGGIVQDRSVLEPIDRVACELRHPGADDGDHHVGLRHVEPASNCGCGPRRPARRRCADRRSAPDASSVAPARSASRTRQAKGTGAR